MHKILLGAYPFTFLVMLILFIALIIMKVNPIVVVGLFIIRLLSQEIVLLFAYKKLLEKKLLLISPVIELIITLLYPVLVSINLVYKESKWK